MIQPTKPGRCARAWAEFERTVMPPNAGPLQRDETRKAFYAGMAQMWSIFMRELAPAGEVTTEDEALLTGIDGELQEFGLAIMRAASNHPAGRA